MGVLQNNPIHCVECNLEVEAEELNLPQKTVNGLAYWTSLFNAIYILWLSESYQEWAKKELENIQSPINILGIRSLKTIPKQLSCFYWFFQDQSEETFAPISCCPICHQPMKEYLGTKFKQVICEKCMIIGAGE
jgi:hypothetical protein